jgi:RNA polymerase sigma factor (sigma-70 family)
VINEAADRMIQRAHFMNGPLAIGYRMPRSLLEIVAVYAVEQIASLREFGLRSVMAGSQGVASLTGKSRTVKSPQVVLASGLTEEQATRQSSRANEMHARFQREIVPHLDAAYNFARFLSRNADAAQDIVQEAFLRAYRGFDGYQGGDARAWIFTIVRNCYHNWLLEHRRKARIEVDLHRPDDAEGFSIDDVPSDEDTPEASLLRRAESSTVRTVLDKLPRPLREMLVLRELEGLSYRQIAETIAMPIGTVMSRLARARTQFESAWREQTGSQEKQK